jgi:hypothetical protein
MAKRRKTEPAEPVAKRVIEVIAEKHLKTLLSQCRGHEKNIAEYTGSLREKIAYAKDKQNLHTASFSTVRKLDKMEPEALALWFEHFDHMCDIAGLRKRAESAPSLLDSADEEGDGDEEATTRRGPRGVVGGTEANVG